VSSDFSSALSAASGNPYPGLRPFEELEEYLFFGREKQINQMVDTLAAQRLLAVVGSSGSGKSSLVNCGLQPALHRGLMASAGSHWRMVRFRPGLRPIASLAAALAAVFPSAAAMASPDLSLADVIDTNLRLSRLGLVDIYGQMPFATGQNLLVVVDQFEELFRYRALRDGGKATREPEALREALALVNLLLTASGQRQRPIFVVITMRSDFLGDCAQYPALPEAIAAGLYLVPRLSRDERRQAIANPALLSGTQIEPVLLTQLVNDAGDDPDQLSILQHALNRTWSHWQQRGGQGPITLADYQAIGTMATALDSHAEQTLADFVGTASGGSGSGGSGSGRPDSEGSNCGGTEKIRLCGRIFRALTDKASDPRGIRRPTTLTELRAICGGGAAAVDQLIDQLIDHFRRHDRAFLMPPASEALQADSVIDISHESLMRLWRRLDGWATEEAASANLFLRLADAARRHGQGQASLWRDPELQLGLNWRNQEQPNPAWARRYDPDFPGALAFLDQSQEAREQERRRRRHRRLLSMAGLAGLSLVASLVASFCWSQWQQTRVSRARAFAATASALLPARPHESLLYGLAAMDRLIQDPAEALLVGDTLAKAVSLNWEIAELESQQPAITALLLRRNGDWITAASDGSLQRWRDARPLGAAIATGQGQIQSLLELSDGVLVSGGENGSLRLWRDSQPLGPALPRGDAAVLSLVQLSDGELVSGDAKGNLRRWRNFRPIGAPIPTGQGRLTALLALPGGQLLSGGSGGESETASRELRLWRQGRPVGAAIRTGHDGVVQLIARGDQVISLGSEGKIQVWRPGQQATKTWQAMATKPMATPVRRLAPLGANDLITSHDDGSLRRWHGDRLAGLGYAASAGIRQLLGLENGRILAADAGQSLRLLQPSAPIDQPVASGQLGIWSLLVQANGQVISGGEDGSLRRWRQGKPVGAPLATGQGSLWALGALANGDLISGGTKSLDSGEELGSLRVWRGSTALSKPVPSGMGPIRQLLPAGREQILAIGDGGIGDGASSVSQLRRWRISGGTPVPLGAPEALSSPRINSIVQLPNGDLLSASRIDGQLQRWQFDGASLRRGEAIPTNLEGIGSLTLLEGGRYLVIGSVDRRYGGQDVIILNLESNEWVGSPLKLNQGWASSLAVLPDRGLVIGTTTGDLRWIQPQRILAAACSELLGGGARGRSQTASDAAGLEVERLARQACKR
jgi:WD40 repeat protein/DNA-directed RNA polymerase specialized sigma24 family protein